MPSPIAGTRRPLCRRVLAVGFAILVAGVSSPWPASAALAVDEALRLAEQRSSLLPAQDASALAARERAVAAGRRPDPMLSASLTNLPVTGDDRFSVTRDFMTMRSVGLKQQLTRGSKLEARAGRFEREAEVAEAQRALALLQLRRDTAVAWFDRLYEERMREVLVEQRDEARLQIDAADAVYRGGGGTQVDAFAARTAVERLEDRIAVADRQIATATARLARWIGPAADGALAPPPPMADVMLHDDLLERELERHPQLELMRRREAAATAAAQVARSERAADLSVEVMYSQRGPAYSNMVSINLSMPLQWDQKNRQDREVAAGLAAVEQLRGEREDAARVLVAEATTMLHEWRSYRRRVARYESALIPLAGERTRAALAAYRGGSGPLAAVLQGRETEIATRLERLGLERDAAQRWAQINYLLPDDRAAVEAQR